MDFKKTFIYGLYDAGNSNFATLIPSIAFPIYFKTIIVPKWPSVDLIWGIFIITSTTLVILLGPKLGERADRKGTKLFMLKMFTWFAIFGTAAMIFQKPGQFILSASLFLLANTSFLLAVVFYDATLVNVSSKDNAGGISSTAWGIGYLGGLIGLILSLLTVGNIDNRLRSIFLIAAGLFFLFTLPILLFRAIRLEEKVTIEKKQQSIISIFKNFLSEKIRLRLFLAYFLYSNGISTIMYFTAIYATDTLGYTIDQLLWLFVAMSIVAVPSVIVFGRLADKLGHIKILKFIVLMWIFVVLAVSVVGPKSFAVVACIASSLFGPIQALSRSLFRIIFPPNHMSSFFGIQSVAARSSAVIGPLIFGAISSFSGSQRLGVVSTALLLGGGLLLLYNAPRI